MESSRSARRFYSYPTLVTLPKEASRFNLLNSNIYMLSADTMERIIRLFSYKEIVILRGVCLWFHSIAGSILNKKFLGLSDSIAEKVEETKGVLDTLPSAHGYLRILYIVKSEVKVLEACCWDYVCSSMFHFTGGMILDVIDSILDGNSEGTTELVSKLFFLTDGFLDYFDFVIELQLLKKSVHLPLSWFGKKMVEILECCLSSEKRLNVRTEDGRQFDLECCYSARKAYSVKKPPEFDEEDVLSLDKMISLMKYVRDHVRWNNFLQLQEEYGDDPSGASAPNSGFYFHVTLHLRCPGALAPSVCRSHLVPAQSWESLHLTTDDYQFSAFIEMCYVTEEYPVKHINQSIRITQVKNKCFYSSELKNDLPVK